MIVGNVCVYTKAKEINTKRWRLFIKNSFIQYYDREGRFLFLATYNLHVIIPHHGSTKVN